MAPLQPIRTRPNHASAQPDVSRLRAGAAPPLGHAVQFYEDEHFLAAAVADFLGEALDAGGPAIVIATPAHRDAFWSRLQALDLDVTHALQAGRLTWLDARDTLAEIMDGARPDARRFHAVLGGAVAARANEDGRGPIRLYGEMVDLLWQDGNTDGAIRLEELWNELAGSHAFSLLCAYAMGHFSQDADRDQFEAICRQHTHVIPTERYTEADSEGRLLEITLLQQRAHALETEIENRAALEQQLRDSLRERREAADALRGSEQQLRAVLVEVELLLGREQQARADAEAANRAKSAFLAAMSHELRTPLNAIGGYVQLVEMGVHGPVTEAQRKALSRAQRGQQHLLALINDILNFAKLEAGRVEYQLHDLVLADVVDGIAPMVAPSFAAKGIAYEVRIPADATVCADREKLEQILLNLLSNAVKFTDAGGRVVVDVATRDGAPSGAVYLRVSDTGCGIAADQQHAIFDPFVQVPARLIRTQEGTGLGLAISRDLARGMRGDLRVRSIEGQGATFTLMLCATCGVSHRSSEPTGTNGARA